MAYGDFPREIDGLGPMLVDYFARPQKSDQKLLAARTGFEPVHQP